MSSNEQAEVIEWIIGVIDHQQHNDYPLGDFSDKDKIIILCHLVKGGYINVGWSNWAVGDWLRNHAFCYHDSYATYARNDVANLDHDLPEWIEIDWDASGRQIVDYSNCEVIELTSGIAVFSCED